MTAPVRPPADNGPSGKARTDPSVSLLSTIVETAMDPGYADEYQRSQERERRDDLRGGEQGRDPRRRAHRAGLGAILVLSLAGLVTGVAIADVRSTAIPQAREARDVLVIRVADRVAITDAAEDRVAQLRAEVAALTDQASGVDQTRADDRAIQAGTIEVTGSGVVVTVDDAEESPSRDNDADIGRVLDRDLQVVANGLWAAGADAIAINGQRLTSTSAIRAAGEAILVDYRPLSRPYVVSAIGPATLRSQFVTGSGGLALRTLSDSYGIRFGIDNASDLVLPAGTNATLRYAQPNGPLTKESDQ